jgi:transcriptional regulator with XRE-family HTH domain
MDFGSKIKTLRLEKNMTQKDLAKAIGVSTRSLINYETGRCYPRQASVVANLSEQLGVTADYLLSDEPDVPKEVSQKDADVLVRQLAALFAGGQLNEQDRDAAMQALQKAYWDGRKQDQ